MARLGDQRDPGAGPGLSGHQRVAYHSRWFAIAGAPEGANVDVINN